MPSLPGLIISFNLTQVDPILSVVIGSAAVMSGSAAVTSDSAAVMDGSAPVIGVLQQ